MSTDILYEYYLLDGSNNFLSPDGGYGEKPYIDCVENWQDQAFEFTRHKTYHGIFNSIIAPLKFHGILAENIRLAYRASGVNADLQLEIRMKDTTSQRFVFVDRLAFQWSSYKEVFDGIECELTSGGLTSYIEANESKSYDLSYQKAEKVDVEIAGMWLYGYQEWLVSNFVDNAETDAYWAKKYIPLSIYDKNTEYSEISAYLNVGKVITYASVTEKNQLLIVVNRNGNYLFSGGFAAYYKNSAASADNVRLQLYAVVKQSIDSNVTVSATLLWQDPNTLAPGSDRNIYIQYQDIAVAAQAGQAIEVYLADKVTSPVVGRNGFSYAIGDADYFRVDTRFQLPAITVQGLRYYGALQQLVYKMTEDKYTLSYSDYMHGAFKERDMIARDVILTSDTAMRGDTFQWLTLNFEEAIKDLQSRAAIGVGIKNNGVYISVLSEFYQKDTVISDIGEVANLVIEPASDRIFNKLILGYDFDDTEDGNAQFAFNIPVEWGSSIKQKFEELDTKSNFIADPFAIIKVVAETLQKDTNDRKTATDNVYALYISPNPSSGKYGLLRPGAYTGFPFDMNPFNWPLSPKRSLDRKATEVHSNLFKTGTTLELTTRNRVLPASSTYSSGLVEEYSSPYDFSYAPLLYKPEYFTFDAKKLPNNFIYLLQQNKYGVIRFSYLGAVYEGFVIELTVKGREGARFKLLSSPKNNT